MRRTRMALAGLLAALTVGAAPAGAVTFTEFEIEPGAPAGKHLPRFIKSGPDGNLWYTLVGDTPGVARISPTGERFTLIPDADGPTDLAFAPDGTAVWTADAGTGQRAPSGAVTLKPGSQTWAILVSGNGAQFYWGVGQAVGSGPSGLCWWSAFDINTKICRNIPAGATVRGLAVGPGGLVWSAWYGADALVIGPASSTGTGAATQLDLPVGSGPVRLAQGPDGNMWVSMNGANAIDRIAPDRTRTRFPLAAGSSPQDIVAGPDGAMWFTEYGPGRIGRITMDGVVTGYDVPTPGSGPVGITVGPDGALWFAEALTGKIGRLVPDPPAAAGEAPPAPAAAAEAAGTGAVAPGAAVPGAPIAPIDAVAPSLGRATVAPTRLKATRRGGATLSFSLSEAARVELTVARAAVGRRVNGRCVAPAARNRRRTACTRYLSQRTTSASLGAGARSMPVATRSLSPGRYRASLVATDAAGNAASPVTTTFTITR